MKVWNHELPTILINRLIASVIFQNLLVPVHKCKGLLLFSAIYDQSQCVAYMLHLQPV